MAAAAAGGGAAGSRWSEGGDGSAAGGKRIAPAVWRLAAALSRGEGKGGLW